MIRPSWSPDSFIGTAPSVSGNDEPRSGKLKIHHHQMIFFGKSCPWSKYKIILLMEEILHQLRLVVYPILDRVLYIPGGAGFLLCKIISHFCCNCKKKRNKHETATENLWLPTKHLGFLDMLWLDPKNIPIKHPGGMTGRLGNGTVDASEIPNNQPGMYKTPVNNGTFTISTGDSPDFFHQHYHIPLIQATSQPIKSQQGPGTEEKNDQG